MPRRRSRRKLTKRQRWAKNVKASRRRSQKSAARLTRRRAAPRSCPAGKIRRSAYMRRGYRTRSGHYVKKTAVSSKCIKNRGRPGKGPNVIGPLKKDALKRFGYSSKKSVAARHLALDRAVAAGNPKSVFYKLNAVAILTKNVNPALSRKFRGDAEWVRRKFRVKRRKRSTKRRRKRSTKRRHRKRSTKRRRKRSTKRRRKRSTKRRRKRSTKRRRKRSTKRRRRKRSTKRRRKRSTKRRRKRSTKRRRKRSTKRRRKRSTKRRRKRSTKKRRRRRTKKKSTKHRRHRRRTY